MIRKSTLWLLGLVLSFGLSAQSERNCATMLNLEQRMDVDSKLQQNMRQIESFTNEFMQNHQSGYENMVQYTIPVVVHVIYSNSNENISTAQIQSQIDVLNEDFRRTNSDADNTWSQAADTEINFCLASVDPNGNATNGITRKSSTRTSWGTNDAMKSSAQGGVDAWPRDSYLNMWVCNIGGGILGYAQFPGGAASTDGVVMSPQYFGRTGFVSAPFDLGRTTTHEVGHWLNLRHIWGDGNCNQDDFVSDTPTSDAPNYGCAIGHVSCSSTDMVQNYMDYSDDACMNLYTLGQKTRMQAVLAPGGFRASLANSNGCGQGQTPTCTDGVQNGNETGVDCGGPDCAPCQVTCNVSDVTLTINLDNYPEETSWSITSGGSTVASGGTYGSQPDGSTVTETVALSAGDYTFTINDSYGDGICCGYGNGSYSLVDGASASIASGGNFGSSESTSFCIEGGGGGDTQAPSTPGNVTASNIGTTTADVNWNASTDNVGVVQYNVFLNGSSIGSVTGTSASLTGLSEGTTYTVGVSAEDAAGNESSQGTDTFTTQENGSCTNATYGTYFFESGLEGWSDGGSDCARVSSSRSYEGSYSVRLRDNTNSSVTTSPVYDLSDFDQVEVEFYFYPRSMENGEDFWVQFYNGSTYQTVASYAAGTSFNNNSFYVATVTVDASSYNFGSNNRIRFRCDASGNSDFIYLDEITVTGICGSGRNAENSIVKLHSLSGEETRLDSDIQIYPNPANDFLNVQIADEEVQFIQIYGVNGALMKSLEINQGTQRIDISELQTGMYFIQIQSGEETTMHKFIKM